jgi:hypothetical protein
MSCDPIFINAPPVMRGQITKKETDNPAEALPVMRVKSGPRRD